MKNELDRIRNAPPTVHTDFRAESLDPRPLIGLPRQVIQDALGPRVDCPRKDLSRFEYSCDAYRFYNLPTGAGGGGPNLQIYSDGYGICVRTLWLITM